MARKTARTRIADCNVMVGQWLKRKRKSAKLSQTLLAKKIGKHRSFVADYEAGRIGLEIGVFLLICKKTKSDPLVGLEEPVRWCVI